MTVQVNC